MSKQYSITNLDCPMCAQRIEDDLKKMPIVRSVSIDFASASLSIDTSDIDAVRKSIRSAEPGVDIHDMSEKSAVEADKAKHRRTELINIGLLIGSILFLVIAILIERSVILPNAGPVAIAFFANAYLLAGGGVPIRAVKNMLAGQLFDEYFLMTVATVGAFAIGELSEAVAVMAFFKAGEILQDRSVRRSRGEIQRLLDLQPDDVRVIRDGEAVTVQLADLVVGDVISARPGERIASDGIVRSGTSTADTSALTGESAPVKIEPGDEVLGGYLNLDSLIQVEVTRTADSSSAARIAELVDNALKRKARTERFITRFARIYTPIVIGIALLIAALPPLLSDTAFSVSLYRALTLLVISCPCALVISIPLTYFASIGGASSRGILVKGATVIDALARARTFVFDKTGTMTHGEFDIQKVVPHGTTDHDRLLSIAASAERESNHPIAKSIMRSVPITTIQGNIERYEERRGRGVIASIDGKTVLAGNDPLLHEEGIDHDTCDVPGTTVHVAEDGTYAGYIVIGDRLRGGALGLMDRLKRAGAKLTVMLTGDHRQSAQAVADDLRIDRVYSGLLPEEKVTVLEEIMAAQGDGNTVFIGDGLNDAPVIARADVGVAMGLSGSEATIETADIVLMSDDPGSIVEAVERARKTRRIVIQNLVFIFAVKAGALLLGAMGIATMWEAVIADTGITIVTVLNAIRALR